MVATIPCSRRRRTLLVCSLALAVACSGKEESPRTTFGGDRPVDLQIPSGYDGSTPLPLLLVLHGYGAFGRLEQTYFLMDGIASAKGTFVLAPDGTLNAQGQRFWNATDACCGAQSGVDDVAYLTGLIRDVQQDYRVDPRQIYVVGHSNGAFMAHRLACDAAAGVAAIVSLAGAQWLDSTRCAPSQPVSVAQVHGTDDQVIAYAGGSIPPPYPGAVETVTRWQVYDGCSPGLVDAGAALDLVPDLPGSETVRQRFAGCPSGIGVELWTIGGGPHIPVFDPSWPDEVWSFLSAHPKL